MAIECSTSANQQREIDNMIELIDQLESLKARLVEKDAAARTKALNLSRQLTATLTDPADRAMEIIFTPFISSGVQTAVRMQLFDHLAAQRCPISTSSLAKLCNAEELMTARILRLLASLQFVSEISSDTWAANATTHVMANPAISAGHRFVWDIQVEGTIKSSQFLQETGFKSPSEPKDGFIQYAQRTKYDVFEYMAKVRPDRLRDFHLFMGNTMGSGNYWVDWYPVQKNILDGYDGSSPLLIDVGGGKGHDIRSFADKFPQAEGELILQDIEPALATIPADQRDSRITYCPQDFFKPNVVKGARVYFLHHILHDWSDKYSLQILRNLKQVMKPGYSKLLIHDLVLPDEKCNSYLAGWDQVMMTFNAGIERSRSQWKALLEEAGFKFEGIWYGEGGENGDGIVQAVFENGEGVDGLTEKLEVCDFTRINTTSIEQKTIAIESVTEISVDDIVV